MARFVPVSVSISWVFLALCAGSVQAQDWEGKWRLEGRHPTLGPVRSHLEITRQGETLAVSERLELSGQTLPRRWTGPAGQGSVLLSPVAGMAGALGGGQATSLRLRLDGAELQAEVDEGGTLTLLRGEREGGGLRDLMHGDLKGKLLVLAEKELRKAAWKGVKLEEDFALSRYLHLGVGAGVRAIPPEQQLPEQRRALELHVAANGGRAAWIATEVHGGPRVPVGTTLDLGQGVSVGLGFEAGARVRYLVEDLYPLPGGVDETLRALGEVGARAIDLPLSAAEAEALGPGARRVLEGEGWVAVSGSLAFGREVKTYGEDVVRIGASLTVGGAYRIGGLLRYEATRLEGQAIRLRVTRGTAHTRSASADLLLGAALGESWTRTQLEPAVDYLSSPGLRGKVLDGAAGAVADAVSDALQVRLRASDVTCEDEELELIWRLDLARPAARQAWERALRGDLTALDAAARDAASGVVQELRVLALEERTWLAGELKVSVLLRAGWSKTSESSDLDVLDATGRTRYEVFRFSRARHWKLLGARERRRSLSLEVVRAAPEGGALRRALRYVLDVEDPITTADDAAHVTRALASWGLETGSSLPEPDRPWFRSRYGPTRTQLVVEIGEEGVLQALGAGRERWFQAYQDAVTALQGEAPLWASEWGRTRLSFPPGEGDQDLSRERQELERANDFVDGMQVLAAGTSAEARADALRELANAARYDLFAITALVKLVPRESLHVAGSLAGAAVAIDSSWAGERFEARALFGTAPRDVIRARALEAAAALPGLGQDGLGGDR